MRLFGLFSKWHAPKFATGLGEELFSMHEHSHITAADFDQTEEQKVFVFSVSDDALEKAGGGTPPAHPGTGVATICVREPSNR